MDYPAALLLSWKKTHEAKFAAGTAEALKRQQEMQQHAFLRSMTDQEIDREVALLRKARHISGFDAFAAAERLAARVDKTELVGGSAERRARALAWAARLLVQGPTPDRAADLLRQSRAIAPTAEADIAEAFIIATTDKESALAKLGAINSAAARSAALRIVTNHGKESGALDWAERAGLTIPSFDAEGKLHLIANQLHTSRWDDAIRSVAMVTEEDLSETPALLQLVAMTWLIQAVPEQLRSIAISQVPFDAARFPLASDAAALEARRKAILYFSRLSEFVTSVGGVPKANPASDHALWLKLRDPVYGTQALEELRESMRDESQALRRVSLALQFGVKLDISAIERRIDQSLALTGKGTEDGALARFALAFVQKSPRDVAEYIAAHRKELYEYLERSAIVVVEIEMLARAGLSELAEQRLGEEVAAGLGESEQRHATHMLAEARGVDAVAERRRLYESTGAVTDLTNLVRLMEEREAWSDLCAYAKKLFVATRSVEDAARYARCLDTNGQYDELLEFLSAQGALVAQSPSLRILQAWSLYRDGQFAAATSALDQLGEADDNPNARVLRVNIAVASGEWHQLVQHTTDEWNNRDSRSAKELLAAASLAYAVGAPHARELTAAAAERAPTDPAVLMGAYFQLTGAGLEQDQVTAGWLHSAAALSSGDGPVKSVSLKEIIEQKPEWDRHETSVWERLVEGKIPMLGAAYMLNRSLCDFVLLPSLANREQLDPRRRTIVYAYSGAMSSPKHQPTTIALDLAAILTFARLGLLETVKSSYDVKIPHSTLSWLFQERSRARFHQPSRIRDAHELKRLISEGVLKVLRIQSRTDNALGKEVGIDLADMLLTAKERSGAGDGVQRYVIRSSPVHRIGSLLEEAADLSEFSGYLCSCHAIVDKLKSKGLLTREEEQNAMAFLQLHENRWLSEPAIADGAEVFLDDLSVNYLRSIGVLRKLKAAGLTVNVSESADDDANRLIEFEHLLTQQLDVLETVRRSLADGLRSEQIRTMRSDQQELIDTPIRLHPTLGILSLEGNVDALVIDDRFVNRHAEFGKEKKSMILSSLAILENLHERGLISAEQMFGHRTFLRQAGYQFVSVGAEELSHHLSHAPLMDGAVVETAELRAIRESLLMARVRRIVQIPVEAPWLHRTMYALITSLKHLWRTRADVDEAKIYSEWILGLFDIRGWAPSAVPGNERAFAIEAFGAHMQSLMMPPDDIDDEREGMYLQWADDRVVSVLRETEPEVFSWIVDRVRELIVQAAERTVAKAGNNVD